ncbi:MAG: molybdopterin molybdotransferase MoeA [Hyphomicrobiales bacterium]|nr:molybdopterin molybdotransferase MoeA [Hyphomicrobiales bacterium]
MTQARKLLSVDAALEQMLESIEPLPPESVSLVRARGRVLCENACAHRSHPAFDVSAMDGYAVRSEDVAQTGASLSLAGSIAAGDEQTDAAIQAGETMRIFTGARLPRGADAILIQENARQDGKRVTFSQAAQTGRYVRRKGSDFAEGDELLNAGHRLRERDLALLAAMGHVDVDVRRKPRVAVLALGNELAAVEENNKNKLPSSNSIGMVAFLEKLDCDALDIGIAPDDVNAVGKAIDKAKDCDFLVTMGGASVGEHDLTRSALEASGFDICFHGVAVRPGKPLLFAMREKTRALGMPGNPVSTMVCAEIFLRPALAKMQGATVSGLSRVCARLTRSLPANNERQEYMRAQLAWDADEQAYFITPFESQDSARLSMLAHADAFAVRPPFDKARDKGESIDALLLD